MPLLTDIPTQRLLLRAGISQNYWHVWWWGCVYQGGIVWVPDAEVCASLERLFGDQLRAVVPTLTLRTGTPTRPPATSPTRKSIFNKRPQPTPQSLL